MHTVTVYNLAGRPLILGISHQDVCKRTGRCYCGANNGETALHCPAGTAAKAIPGVWLLSRHVRAAQRAGLISVVPDVTIEPATPAPAPAPVRVKRRKKRSKELR